jgi:hypothetical protein
MDFCKLLTIRSEIQESGQRRADWSNHLSENNENSLKIDPRQANEWITIYAYGADSPEDHQMQQNINQKVDHRLCWLVKSRLIWEYLCLYINDKMLGRFPRDGLYEE